MIPKTIYQERISRIRQMIESREKELAELKSDLIYQETKLSMIETQEARKRTERMARFITHNSGRKLVALITFSKITDNGEAVEDKNQYILKPGEYRLYRNCIGKWVLRIPDKITSLLEYVDSIYAMFE